MLSLQHLIFAIKVLQVGKVDISPMIPFRGMYAAKFYGPRFAYEFVILVTKFDDLLFSHNLFETSLLTLPIFPFAQKTKKTSVVFENVFIIKVQCTV